MDMMYILRHTCQVHVTCTWYLHCLSILTMYISVMCIGFKFRLYQVTSEILIADTHNKCTPVDAIMVLSY